MRKVRERVCILKGCKCSTGQKIGFVDVQKRAVKCSEGCQCTNCENTISLPCDREDLAEIALEEQVESNIATNEDDEEFAEFIFAAAFDDTSI